MFYSTDFSLVYDWAINNHGKAREERRVQTSEFNFFFSFFFFFVSGHFASKKSVTTTTCTVETWCGDGESTCQRPNMSS